MPQHESYLLHIWRSRALSGWQWVARVDRLSDGERVRFADPEALLLHLQNVVRAESQEQGAGEGRSDERSRTGEGPLPA